MKEELPLFNLSDPEQALRLIRHIGTLRGVHRVKLEKVRDQRSLSQNAYYWGVVLPHVAKGIRDGWGENDFDSYDAHEFLKDRFLKIPVVNRETGELKGFVKQRSAELNVEEFCGYIERVIEFSLDQLGVAIPPATRYANIPQEDAA